MNNVPHYNTSVVGKRAFYLLLPFLFQIKALADTFLLDAAIFENMLATRLLPNQQVWTDEEYLDLYLDCEYMLNLMKYEEFSDL